MTTSARTAQGGTRGWQVGPRSNSCTDLDYPHLRTHLPHIRAAGHFSIYTARKWLAKHHTEHNMSLAITPEPFDLSEIPPLIDLEDLEEEENRWRSNVSRSSDRGWLCLISDF